MVKRIMLSLTFLAAFGLVGVATPDTSEARRYWRRPFVGRYYAPRPYYFGRPYYRAPYRTYYGPRYYDYPRYYGPRRGIYFSWGY